MQSVALSRSQFGNRLQQNFSTLSMHTNASIISRHNDAIFLPLIEPEYEDKLHQLNCDCLHCKNNTKPIGKQVLRRITDPEEHSIEPNQAYTFVITHLIDYLGSVKVPDTYVAEDSSMVYFGNRQKIKAKNNLIPSDIKKYFDTRKSQYTKMTKQYSGEKNSPKKKILANKSQLSKGNQSVSKEATKDLKEVAFIHYSNGFSQIVTDQLLTKYLAKRKVDPFWQEICSISLIPPHKEKELYFHRFDYERNQDNVQEMNGVMERVAKALDRLDLLDSRQELSEINPEISTGISKALEQVVKINQKKEKELNKRPPLYQSPHSKSGHSVSPPSNKTVSALCVSIEKVSEEQRDRRAIENISKEIIAYFEVKLHIRILKVHFKFCIDYENGHYLTGVEQLIVSKLRPNQLLMVHDRYKTLEQAESTEIAERKLQVEELEKRHLKSVLAQLMLGCLEERKLELKNSKYRRPSNQNLVLMFKRLLPSFEQSEVFDNPNWKNQFKVYLSEAKAKIARVIKQDEGIRILKRFGIEFYRTWNKEDM